MFIHIISFGINTCNRFNLMYCSKSYRNMRRIVIISVLIVMFAQIAYYITSSLLYIPPVPVLEEICWGKESDCGDYDQTIRSFSINVSKETIDDLNYRLKNAIIPEPIENAKQHYGFNGNTLRKVIDYWLNEYDWKQREIYLNQFPHFKTKIQGLDIHFIHIKPNVPKGTATYPLLICHGWGGSFREFLEVVPILTIPHEEYGFAFEIVLPSLPGFIFSEATTKPGLASPQIALILRNLMRRIGHKKFYVHGGDWGSIVVKDLATLFPENVLGLHCTLAMSVARISWVKYLIGGVYPRLIVSKEFEDRMYPIREKIWNFLMETGYLHIQATKPDTVGTAIANSPVGLAAYLLEKFSTLANSEFKNREDAGLLERYTYVKLIDNLMLYWVTRSITSASRIYYEGIAKRQSNLKLGEIPIDSKIPCAVARFPNEVFYQPDYILKDKFPNLVQSTDFEEGGHFAALENGLSEVFAQDIFSAVNKMRNPNDEIKNDK